MNVTENKINNLYDHYKNTPKKLKIVCDWDEVIQAHYPYLLLKATNEISGGVPVLERTNFPKFFEGFWNGELKDSIKVNYFSYGSSLMVNSPDKYSELVESIEKVKNSSDFYEQTPFLTIAKELLLLIRENKIERLVFLSAYDKREFPTTDLRKVEIFNETFGKILGEIKPMLGKTVSEMREEMNQQVKKGIVGGLILIPFDSETSGQSKADWIKENASDFDLVIDDNPFICKSIVENLSNPISEKEQEIEKILTNSPECELSLQTSPHEVKRKTLAGFYIPYGIIGQEEPKNPICIGCWMREKETIKKKPVKYCSLEKYLGLEEGKFESGCRFCLQDLNIKEISGYEMMDDGVEVYDVVCQKKKCIEACDNFRTVSCVREMKCGQEEKYWKTNEDELDKFRPINHATECECNNCGELIGNREFYFRGEGHWHSENDLECKSKVDNQICENEKCKKPIKVGELHYNWDGGFVKCPLVVDENTKKLNGFNTDELTTNSMIVCSPYYPAVESQHDKGVLLVKNEVSDLKKEDF